MRLLKAVLAETYMECSKVVKASDCDILETATHKIDNVCSRAEDNMFNDFPKVGNEYIDVFYGTPGSTCRSEVDTEQVKLMIKLVKELFKDNWE